MKKLISIIILCFILINGLQAFGISEIKENQNYEIVELINFSDLIIKEKEQKIIVSVENTNSYTKEPDYPILPIYSKIYNFPIGTIIDNVHIKFSESKKIILENEIVSNPVPVTFKDGKRVTYSQTKLFSDIDIYPEELFRYYPDYQGSDIP